MAIERPTRRDKEKEKRLLELSRYSHNLSHKILTVEGKSQLANTIPDEYVASFQKGSLLDRDSYWQENAPTLNFGQQMVEWVGMGEKPGIAQWVDKQADTDVVSILSEVGLKGDAGKTKEDMQGEKVQKLLKTINTDLVKAGEEPLEVNELSEAESRSLIFYAHFLNPHDKKGDDAKSLIDTIVGVASREGNGSVDATVEKLQKITPLLRVVGDEGQHILGALMVAKTHAMDGKEDLGKVVPDAVLTDEENKVLEFLRNNREYEAPELEAGKKYNVEELLTELMPEGFVHAYVVEGEIPNEFVKTLSSDQIKSLEITKPYWVEADKGPSINAEVFPPVYNQELEDNERFINADIMTEGGLNFALAAVSAKTPQEQARLYKTLGETILRAHTENPQLVDAFLKAQTADSLEEFSATEAKILAPKTQEAVVAINQEVMKQFKEKFGVDFDPKKFNMLSKDQKDQATFIQEETIRLAREQLVPLYKSVEDPSRQFSISLNIDSATGEVSQEVDIAASSAIWPERIKQLEEVFAQDPLSLTPEQIRQLEFLSHSVNTVKVIEWLQARQAISEPLGPTPVSGEAAVPPLDENRAEVQADDPLTPEVSTREASAKKWDEPLTVSELFSRLESIMPEGLEPRRPTMVVANVDELEEFSTRGKDIRNYEILNAEGDGFEVYTISKGPDGKLTQDYNHRDPFLLSLFASNSISEYIFQGFEQLQLEKKAYYGKPTFISYVTEAAKTPKEQEELFTKLFYQVARMYRDNDTLRVKARRYYQDVAKQIGEGKRLGNLPGLFGSHDVMQKRLLELEAKLNNKEPLSPSDFANISLYTLPFNAQTIMQNMNHAYKISQATAAPLTQ